MEIMHFTITCLYVHCTSAYIIRHDSLLLCLVAFVNGKKDTEIFVQRKVGLVVLYWVYKPSF